MYHQFGFVSAVIFTQSLSLLQLLLLSLWRYPCVSGLVLVLGGMLAVIWSQGQFLLAECMLLALL